MDNKNVYWPPEMDDHIIRYNQIEDKDESDEYFNRYLMEPILKLCECVMNKNGSYQYFVEKEGSDNVMKLTMSHLMACFRNYDRSKGPSFSYFNMAARNYMILQNKKLYLDSLRFDEIIVNDDDEIPKLSSYNVNHDVDTDRYVFLDFMDQAKKYWQSNYKFYYRTKLQQETFLIFLNMLDENVFDASFKTDIYKYILHKSGNFKEYKQGYSVTLSRMISTFESVNSELYKQYHRNNSISYDKVIIS